MYMCDPQLGNMHVRVQNSAVNNLDFDSDRKAITTADAIIILPHLHTLQSINGSE